MCKYDDVTLEPVPPNLAPGEKEHVLIPQDKCIVKVNDSTRRQWLKDGQQPLKKKGNGCAIHICGWICETTSHLKLSEEQITAQTTLSEAERLWVTDSHKIIYPGKNHDAWWDLKQLMEQMKYAVDIFKYLHPDKVGIWLFDCSSAHEGLTDDALNIKYKLKGLLQMPTTSRMILLPHRTPTYAKNIAYSTICYPSLKFWLAKAFSKN
jgi:hypothetical protein